jgi:hypothetical protein
VICTKATLSAGWPDSFALADIAPLDYKPALARVAFAAALRGLIYLFSSDSRPVGDGACRLSMFPCSQFDH